MNEVVDPVAVPSRSAPWGSSLPQLNVRPALQGDVRVGTLIIGAGVAGLSTALHLCERGDEPLVLEAGLIGDGASGASAGIVAPQLIRATPDGVIKRLGEEAGTGTLQLVAESGQYLFDMIARLGIVCDVDPRGFIAPATGGGAYAKLRARVEQWQRWRNDLRVCDAAETRRLTGCKGYGAAIVDPTGGALDPLLLARGLASRSEALGASIREQSAVTQLTREGQAWRATSANGSVIADRVVLAANGGATALHPKLAGTILPLPVCEVATQPVSAALRQVILPMGHSLTDLEPDVFSIRFTSEGRLVTAFPAKERSSITRINEAVNARLAQMLVLPTRLRVDYVWFGTAWVNSNLLPRLVRIPGAKNLVVVQACNGRGLAINALIGREVARTLEPSKEAPLLPLEPPKPISGFLLARHVPRLLMSAALMARRLRRAFEK